MISSVNKAPSNTGDNRLLKYYFNLQKNHQIITLSQSGATLLWISFMLLLISSLAAGILKFANTSSTSEISAHSLQKAYYLAQSGGNYAASYLRESDPEKDKVAKIEYLNNKDYEFVTEGEFSLKIDNSDPSKILIHSTGIANRGSYFESQVQLTFEIKPGENDQSFSSEAIYGSGTVTIKKHASVDAYDSSKGTYDDTVDSNAGDVVTGSDSLNIEEGATIGGNKGDEEDYISVNKNLKSIIFPKPPTRLETIEMPPYSIEGSIEGPNNFLKEEEGLTIENDETLKTSNEVTLIIDGDFEIKKKKTLTIEGDLTLFVKGEFKIGKEAILTIKGDVTLIVDDEFEAEDQSIIILEDGATLTLYAREEIKFEDKSEINTGGIPGNFKIYSTGEEVEIGNQAEIHAAIYAPNADVTLENHAQLFGAIIGNDIKLENHAQIHYDKALGNSTTGDGNGGNPPPPPPPIQYFTK